jgi:predicted Zn-dependent protease
MTFSQTSPSLPALNPHPLPPTLAQWETSAEVGDYFSEVEASPLGYLLWSEFPVTVYLDQSSSKSGGDWVEAVMTAVREWNAYLPLQRVNDRAVADIIIARSRPPLNTTRNPETGMIEFSRARTARTYYEFDIEDHTLIHRMIIEISPDQAKIHTLATARHEIGHALGIWGHSPNPEDALYFSQVRKSPPISERDVNTLKKIYQQPTRLGWEIKSPRQH